MHGAILGSPFVINGDEFENIELTKAHGFTDNNGGQMHQQQQRNHSEHPHHHQHHHQASQQQLRRPQQGDVNSNINYHGDRTPSDNRTLTPQGSGGGSHDPALRQDSSSGYGSESGDMLRDMVKNKEVMTLAAHGGVGNKKQLPKYSSMESDISEGSTLVSSSGGEASLYSGHFELVNTGSRRGMRIKYQELRNTVSDTEVDINMAILRNHQERVMSLLFTCVSCGSCLPY